MPQSKIPEGGNSMIEYKEIKYRAEKIGYELVYWFHLTILFIIGAVILVSALKALDKIYSSGQTTVEDILLLFIYLELGAMVGIYFTTSRMPVNFLLYVGITALTRAIIGNLPHDHKVSMDLLILVGAILILAITVMVLKFSSSSFTVKPKKGREALFLRRNNRKKVDGKSRTQRARSTD